MDRRKLSEYIRQLTKALHIGSLTGWTVLGTIALLMIVYREETMSAWETRTMWERTMFGASALMLIAGLIAPSSIPTALKIVAIAIATLAIGAIAS